jgi:hypothetical protein
MMFWGIHVAKQMKKGEVEESLRQLGLLAHCQVLFAGRHSQILVVVAAVEVAVVGRFRNFNSQESTIPQ